MFSSSYLSGFVTWLSRHWTPHW